MIKIGYWNVRGTKRPLLLQEINQLRCNNSLDILAFSETKTEVAPTESQIKGTGFNQAFSISSIGHKGGIWILYKNSLILNNMQALESGNRFYMIQVTIDNFTLVLLFIYAPSVESEKSRK